MEKMSKTKKIALLGTLSALVIILQIIANILPKFTGVSITLSLTVVAFGAIVFNEYVGAFLGFVNGIVILLAPDTMQVFFAVSPLGTIITCLVKTTVAGFVAGLIMKLLKNKNPRLGAILASICVPIINTGLFAIFALTLLKQSIVNLAGGDASNIYSFLFLVLIGVNFLIEFPLNAIISPIIYQLSHYKKIQ